MTTNAEEVAIEQIRVTCPAGGPHDIVFADVAFAIQVVRQMRICRKCGLKDTYVQEEP